MGLIEECVSSILLCSEDNSSALWFDDDDDDENGVNGRIPEEKGDLFGDSFEGLPLQSEECLSLLFEGEMDHLPQGNYAKRLMDGSLDLSIRNDAIDWISKVHSHYSFGPLSAYLSVNYLDRFLSAYQIPQGEPWMTQLLSVACLSLAAKMEETIVPPSLDLQLVAEAKYVFEARTIRRMEFLVLTTLEWRMQAVTPFSFIDYFLHKFNEGNSPTKASIARSLELILSTIRGIRFLEFRPSEIAAAAALTALGEVQTKDIEKFVTCCIHVNKERVLRCYEVIHEAASMKCRSVPEGSRPSAFSVPRSPDGVLDVASLSSTSDDMTVGSRANSQNNSPAAKRRKMSMSSVP